MKEIRLDKIFVKVYAYELYITPSHNAKEIAIVLCKLGEQST